MGLCFLEILELEFGSWCIGAVFCFVLFVGKASLVYTIMIIACILIFDMFNAFHAVNSRLKRDLDLLNTNWTIIFDCPSVLL